MGWACVWRNYWGRRMVRSWRTLTSNLVTSSTACVVLVVKRSTPGSRDLRDRVDCRLVPAFASIMDLKSP